MNVPGGRRHRLRLRATMRLQSLLFGRRPGLPPEAPSSELPTEAAARIALDLARYQLAAASAGDTNTLAAIGMLAFELAAAAVVIQARGSLDRFWWATAVGLAVSACLLGVSLRRHPVDLGPDPMAFYEGARGGSERKVTLIALEDLRRARAFNERAWLRRARWSRASVWVLASTAIGSALCAAGTLGEALKMTARTGTAPARSPRGRLLGASWKRRVGSPNAPPTRSSGRASARTRWTRPDVAAGGGLRRRVPGHIPAQAPADHPSKGGLGCALIG